MEQIIIYLFFGIIAIVINFFIASKMCEVAELKGYSSKEKHIFAMCFWFGFFGYLYTIALPDLKLHNLLSKAFEQKVQEQEPKKLKHNPNLEAICKTIPGIEL